MKNCISIEKKLNAYLDRELYPTELEAVETHLADCAACREELEMLRTTRTLLSEALEAAPAPEQLTNWRDIPKRVSPHHRTLADYWFSPQFRAGLATAAAACLFIFLSFSFVAYTVITKEEKAFEAAEQEYSVSAEPATRPKMKLKKLELADQDTAAPKPSLRKRIVAKARSPQIQSAPFPEPEPMLEAQLGRSVAGRPMQMDFFGTKAKGSVPLPEFNTEEYDRIVANTFKASMENPLSTFSIDVDRAAYANVRRFLNDNRLPPADAVRIEEMVNYFTYDYPQPEGEDPFVVSTEVAECPWNPEHQLALIGLQGLEIETSELPPNNLVFLLDVSGSMNAPSKLPLLKSAMRLLTEQLRPQDRVSIVVYAGAAGLVLEPTADKGEILNAIKRLSAGGSTAGGAGIELAYKTAQESFIDDGNNRVVLATDGDFNVGVSSDGALTRLIEEKRETGIFLTVLGFGSGNYKDSKMEKLADKGNGNYAYIDDILEAKKVLVSEMGGTLVTIAKDVKVQVEFNPAQVKAYRLIGYENRLLAKEDFDDDTKDAGELGAGHTVTALYELIPAGSDAEVPLAGDLKYQKTQLTDSEELMTVKLRYKQPDGDESKLITRTVDTGEARPIKANGNLGFASSVAEFGMILRGSEYRGTASYAAVLERAKAAKGTDPEGYRGEFIRLVEKAQLLDARH